MKFLYDPIIRRLAPLYAVTFFSGFMLWFAIEKVFMSRLGFTPSDITLASIVVAAVILLTEIPAGILADRWSRKGVLFFGMLSLAAASLLLPFAHSVAQYLTITALIGLFYAFYSGIEESIVYDTLIEERGARDGYEKYYGQLQLANSAALIISSLLGGLIAAKLGLKDAYFISVPFATAAMLSTLAIKEPSVHKKHETVYLLHHIRETFSFVLRRGITAWIMLSLVAFGVLDFFLLDIDQLWPLALALPVVWYGPLNALLLGGYGLGGPLSEWITKKRSVAIGVCWLGLICVLSLSVHNIYVIAAAQFGFIACFSALLIIAEGRLQDEIPSRLRTGALSVASSLTTLCFIPIGYIFGNLTEATSVFKASYLLIPITVAGITGYVIFRKPRENVDTVKPLQKINR